MFSDHRHLLHESISRLKAVNQNTVFVVKDFSGLKQTMNSCQIHTSFNTDFLSSCTVYVEKWQSPINYHYLHGKADLHLLLTLADICKQ